MVSVTQDPTNPDRLVLSATVTVYLDRLLLQTLSSEVEVAIRAQAIADLSSNKVRKLIAKAATEKLLTMLGAPSPAVEEK